MLLTLACLICGLLILIAGTKPTILPDLYFFKVSRYSALLSLSSDPSLTLQ
jgi:hypothetical protein